VSVERETLTRADGSTRERHADDCSCTRCVGFTSGPNGTAALVTTKHGARSLVQIQPRAAEVAEVLRQTLVDEQLWREGFGPTVDACALVLVRMERCAAALGEADERLADQGPLAPYLPNGEGRDVLDYVRRDLNRWANTARGYLNDLGLTPRALAAIAKDTGIARSTRSATALRALNEYVESEHVA
jgi:hypothetical protein